MAKQFSPVGGRILGLFLGLASFFLQAQTPPGSSSIQSTNSVLLAVQGSVEVQKRGQTNWTAGQINQLLQPGDRLRTGPNSRAEVRLSTLSVLPVDALTTILFEASEGRATGPILNLQNGSLFLQSRERPGQVRFRTRMVSGAIRGTEFHLSSDAAGRTFVHLLDGAIELSNDHGQLTLAKNEQAEIKPGQAPVKSALLDAAAIIQWVLYYPAVLDLAELQLGTQEQEFLSRSIDMYRRGDLVAALLNYPADRVPQSSAEALFLAGLYLSTGRVTESEKILEANLDANGLPAGSIPRREQAAQIVEALRKLIDTVRNPQRSLPSRLNQDGHEALDARQEGPQPSSPSLLLARSYAAQKRGDLSTALQLARRAVEISPQFGFGWARVAELEFSFGRLEKTAAALEKALSFAPRHAPAQALQGFIYAAQNELQNAQASFEKAIELDGALASGWLGRGLVHIRRNELQAGREDLQTAAALEPRRGLFRSYLAKAFSILAEPALAKKEIALALELDPNDPTGWLYSALLNQLDSRINAAARDLEKSQELNDNRQVYRSGLLLEQDRAVRSANLAGIYRDAGMREQSVREAARAVSSDYANASAHLFLANSYDALRDPRQINLRYETPWFSEWLLANLLAPVGEGSLSQRVSQQEYSKLFERNRAGALSTTDYYSNGDWLQTASQFGVFGHTSYAVDALYRSETGQRPNHDFRQFTLSASFKQQLTPQDSVYFQGLYYDARGGDLAQYYSHAAANPAFRFKENQEPILLAGYHREWNPGVHTLLLVSRLDDTMQVQDPNYQLLYLGKNAAGNVTHESRPGPPRAPLRYSSEFEAYSTEIQQIWSVEKNTLVAGARYQSGEFDTLADLGSSAPTKLGNNATLTFLSFTNAPLQQEVSPNLERHSVYLYDTLSILEDLRLIGGIAYDRLDHPANFRLAPLSAAEQTEDQFSPKAGLIWTPHRNTALRGAYTRSLGGVSYDQSFRLEPAQLAGFIQSYRTLIPESVAGSLAGARFETGGLELEQKIGPSTFLSAGAELLRSEADRQLGAIDVVGLSVLPSTVQQHLTYEERNLFLGFDQLLDDSWALGARYRLSDAGLNSQFPAIPEHVSPLSNRDLESTLHELNLHALFNHASGFFGQFESIWSLQSNRGYSPNLPGDDFWTFNLHAGWRLWQRRASAQIGLINITDQDFSLSPLNWHSHYYRDRTLMASLRFYF